MAIYYCPHCNKKFFADDVSDADEFVLCSACGCSIRFEELDAYTQKRNDISLEDIADSVQDAFFQLQKMQLEELKSIKNMLKFFTVLTIISLAISFVSVLFLLY